MDLSRRKALDKVLRDKALNDGCQRGLASTIYVFL